MKRTTLAVLTIASVASMAGIASAIPFGSQNLPPGLSGGAPPGLNGGAPSGLNSGLPTGLSGGGGGFNPLITTNTPYVGSVPEGGSGLLLLGAGLLALALLRRRQEQGQY